MRRYKSWRGIPATSTDHHHKEHQDRPPWLKSSSTIATTATTTSSIGSSVRLVLSLFCYYITTVLIPYWFLLSHSDKILLEVEYTLNAFIALLSYWLPLSFWLGPWEGEIRVFLCIQWYVCYYSPLPIHSLCPYILVSAKPIPYPSWHIPYIVN